MSEQDVETLRSAYEAFNRGDVGGVLAILDDDVEWTEPGGGKSPSGTFRGPQEVGDKAFSAVPANFDEFVCTPESFDDQGDTIVVTGRFTGKNKSGADMDSRFTHTWKMKDGKAVSFDNEVDDAWAAGWS
jgi:ketosteroid isomerase-like protein